MGLRFLCVAGWGGSEDSRAGVAGAHTPRKIRRQFQGYKHPSLVFLAVAFYELRFDGVIGSSLTVRLRNALRNVRETVVV